MEEILKEEDFNQDRALIIMRIDYYTIKGLIFYYHLFQYILLCNSQQAQQYIDPITTVKTINRFKDNKQLKLVMSDEFELEGRSFEKGADKFFESITKPDYTNNAMQFCKFDSKKVFKNNNFLTDNSSRHYVTTKEGSLIIRTTAEKTAWDEWDDQTERMVTRTRNYTSGMIQSWNKFCFTGGVIELSIQLPGGHANAGGMIPLNLFHFCKDCGLLLG